MFILSIMRLNYKILIFSQNAKRFEKGKPDCQAKSLRKQRRSGKIKGFPPVPRRGLEPPFPCENSVLNAARLPVSPPRLVEDTTLCLHPHICSDFDFEVGFSSSKCKHFEKIKIESILTERGDCNKLFSFCFTNYPPRPNIWNPPSPSCSYRISGFIMKRTKNCRPGMTNFILSRSRINIWRLSGCISKIWYFGRH